MKSTEDPELPSARRSDQKTTSGETGSDTDETSVVHIDSREKVRDAMLRYLNRFHQGSNDNKPYEHPQLIQDNDAPDNKDEDVLLDANQFTL